MRVDFYQIWSAFSETLSDRGRTVAARQRDKLNWCLLGNEDTRFYHKRASARLRANQIKVIHQDGMPHYSQESKHKILTDYYKNIMGDSGGHYSKV